MLVKRQWVGVGLIVALLYVFSLPQIRQVYELPDNLLLFGDERACINVDYPFTVSTDNNDLLVHSVRYLYKNVQPVFLEGQNFGNTQLTFKLFGVLPVRNISVSVAPAVSLQAGGDSIGIIMQGDGVMVVGNSPVISGKEKYNPAEEAGVRIGDIILYVNGESPVSDLSVAESIDNIGRRHEQLLLTLKRGNDIMEFKVKPMYCQESRKYRIGVLLRDKTMGMGTLTFVEPTSGKYGALGHQITPLAGELAGQSWHGSIVKAKVTEIQAGSVGRPGEKVGIFQADREVLGNIEKNTPLGIYGHLENRQINGGAALSAASRSQVETGYAELLTVINDYKVERFAVEIEKISRQSNPEGKGFVIKVIDERLLARTGGIVQGMSGSPIIQNGRIVGALTHVFINDMQKGYGCFLEWMLEENGILPKNQANYLPFLFG